MIGNLMNIVNDVLEPYIKNAYGTETMHAVSELTVQKNLELLSLGTSYTCILT